MPETKLPVYLRVGSGKERHVGDVTSNPGAKHPLLAVPRLLRAVADEMEACATKDGASGETSYPCGHGPDERCFDCATDDELLAAIPPHPGSTKSALPGHTLPPESQETSA